MNTLAAMATESLLSTHPQPGSDFTIPLHSENDECQYSPSCSRIPSLHIPDRSCRNPCPEEKPILETGITRSWHAPRYESAEIPTCAPWSTSKPPIRNVMYLCQHTRKDACSMRCERTTARFPVRHTAVAAADEATNATISCNIPAWKVRIHSLGLQRLSLALAVHYPLASPIDLGESNVAGSRILLEQEEKKIGGGVCSMKHAR
jgi:hypothetical protein